MTLILSGTDGLSDVDGSAATPAIRGTDANTGIFFPAADTIAFSEGGVESMRIDASGNVGIGTSSPSQLLTLGNTSSIRGQLYVQSPSGSSPTVTLDNTASPSGRKYTLYSGGNSTGDFAIYDATAAAYRMTLDSSGNVGIGNTAPLAKLVVGAAQTNPDSSNTIAQFSGNIELCNTAAQTYRCQLEIDTSTTYISSNTYYSAGWQVFDSARAPAQITLTSANLDSYMAFNTASVNSGNGTERMRLDKSGTLLIGRTAASASRLHIQTVDTTSSNYATIFQDSATVNLFYVRNDGVGYLKAASWTYGSDISLKENVRYLDSNNSLSLITKAKPASFDYINSQKENYGFIAQDVQTWFPEAVVETEGGTLGLKTEFFTPLMVGSIQALNNLIQEQQAIITSLTDRITALEAK